jgi:hypothetical protein
MTPRTITLVRWSHGLVVLIVDVAADVHSVRPDVGCASEVQNAGE